VVWTMITSVAQGFEATATRWPHRPALEYKGEVISYAQLQRVVNNRNAWFGWNDIVVVSIEEGKDLVAVELAIWRVGAIVCPFDVRKDPRAKSIVERLQPALVIVANSEFVFAFDDI
jgi:acyl-CoA synthetase (AMP-forming)/AMP-acid ligase II